MIRMNYPWHSDIIRSIRIIIIMEEKSFYITTGKLKEIKQEYEKLKKNLSLKTKGGIPKVLNSEEMNPEYLLFQEDLNFFYSRKQELENILRNYKLIKLPPQKNRDKVNLGAKVLVEIDGQKDEFEIVGTLEANPALGRISNESPVGKTLFGHKVGDEVTVSSPIKTIYKIKKIRYSSS